MSLFSPITARSASARLLFLFMYATLTLGALSIMIPFLVTFSGATAGAYDARGFSLFPRFLVDEPTLWARYVDAKYGGQIDNLRMAWGESDLDFDDLGGFVPDDNAGLALWNEFRRERGRFSVQDAGLGFTRASKREAAIENRLFRKWLLREFDEDIGRMNAELLTQAKYVTNLLPPVQTRLHRPDVETPFTRKFSEYLDTVADSRRMPWNVGNFYRAVYLPRTFGEEISAFNREVGTDYGGYDEVPFPATAPDVGTEPWSAFVRKVLNPSFVTLTPEGEAVMEARGVGRLDFIRLHAEPGHLRVESIDVAFAAWAGGRGLQDVRIPQRAIDWGEFQAEKAFWRRQFLTQNFVYVLDEVMIQGNGIRNTLILVLLTVGGALTINPMAAYALSRYRPRQRYQILVFFLATIAFPAEVVMIPTFLQLKELGMINTFGALVLPGLVNGFSIFLLKGFFDSLPRELYEAADIDGASEWQIFWGITMNLSKPILAVIALNAFVAAYGTFFFALILAPDQRMWTLMVWIYQLRQTAGPGVVYASLLITAVPTLVVYLCAQNVILRGIVVPTEK